MAALLDQDPVAYRELRRGEIIEGTVVGTDRDGILVDIGAKSEGIIPPNEMHCLQPEGPSKLQTGDKVLVSIVQPESYEGQIILSLDRARGERGWRVLQDFLDANEAFEGYVTGSNKGGLLVNVEGVNAFVPLSQIVAGPDRGNPEATQQALTGWVGKNITLKVIELNRRRNRAILSERSAVQEKRAAEKERLLLELNEGDVRTGRITSIRDFGVFVDIGGADGLVHLSELSWERTPKSPHDLFKVGDEVPVYVLKVDNEAKKIALSVRRAQPERWEEIVSRYREGQIVPGQVTKLAPFGAFVRLEGPIEGLIHISELVDRRINHPKEVVEEGDVLPVKIVRIEYDRHRLGLSLKQAREKAEEDGWAFNSTGGTIKAPNDSLQRLGLDEMPVRAVREPEDEEPVTEAVMDSATEALAVDVEVTDQPAPAPEAKRAPAPTPAPAPVREPEPEPLTGMASAFAAAEAAEAEAAAPEAVAAPEPEAAAEPELEAVVEPEAVAEPEPEAAAEPEMVAEPELEVAAEEETPDADVRLDSEAAEAAEELAAEEPAVQDELAGEAGVVELQEESSLIAGEIAASEGAAPDVTEAAPDAFNKTGESE